jgi:hypothetical protein
VYLRYTPEGSDTQEWVVQLGKLRVFDIEAIERVTDMAYGTEYKQALMKGNGKARRALLWTMLRKAHPTLKYADVDFADDELVLQLDTDELAELKAAVEASTGIPEADKVLALEALDADLRTAPAPPGKAPSPSAEPSIG